MALHQPLQQAMAWHDHLWMPQPVADVTGGRCFKAHIQVLECFWKGLQDGLIVFSTCFMMFGDFQIFFQPLMPYGGCALRDFKRLGTVQTVSAGG